LIYFGNRWDGTHNNKFVNQGVFIYFIKFISLDGSEMNFSGEYVVCLAPDVFAAIVPIVNCMMQFGVSKIISTD